ncbi:MAG: hypothetical protein QW680_02280 [Pyrobaculum sp.]
MKPIIIVVFLSVLALGQVFTIDVDYLYLGWGWVDVPKYPGDFGLVKFSFYLAQRHVDVSVSLYRCGQGDVAKLASAGPGVVEVVIRHRFDKLGTTLDCVLEFKSKYVEKGGGLSSGFEQLEHVRIEVPHYPSPFVSIRGDFVAGLRDQAEVVVQDVFDYNGTVELSIINGRLYSPQYLYGNLKNLTATVEAVVDGPGALLTATIRTRDALGRDVVIIRSVPLLVRPRPLPRVSTNVEWLPAGVATSFKIVVEYPFEVDGALYVLDKWAPLVRGRGEVEVIVTPEAPRLVLPVVAQLETGAVDRVELSIPVYAVAYSDFVVDVRPTSLTIGELSTVYLKASGVGRFVGQINVAGAVALGATPIFFHGDGSVDVEIRLVPTASVVTLDINVVYNSRLERRVLNILATPRLPFDISVTPLEIPSGGASLVKIGFKPRVNVSEAIVTLWPGQGLVFPQRIIQLPRGGGEVELEVVVPEDVVGNVGVNYRVAYTLESGTTGEFSGVVNLLAVQSPRLSIEVSTPPAEPTVGKPFFIVLKIFNTGGVEARDVRAYLIGDVEVVRSPPPLGAVPPQGSKDATFTVASHTPGARELRVVVEYRDKLGRIYTAERAIVVQVFNTTSVTQPSVMSRGDGGLAAVVVLALIGVGVLITILAAKRGRVARAN